jgi:hypothetical protein
MIIIGGSVGVGRCCDIGVVSFNNGREFYFCSSLSINFSD